MINKSIMLVRFFIIFLLRTHPSQALSKMCNKSAPYLQQISANFGIKYCAVFDALVLIYCSLKYSQIAPCKGALSAFFRLNYDAKFASNII